MRIRRSAVAGAVGVGLLVTLLPLTAHAAEPVVYGVALTDGGTRLGRFNVDKPSGLTRIGGTITGLAGDSKLVGIDRRVQNGRLYGVGDTGGIYLMSGERGSKVGQLGVALSGSTFGIDFNPAANALRVVSNTGQNLRQPFGDGNGPDGATEADTALNTAGSPVNGIVSAAYTNNDTAPNTATTLFDIDTNNEQVVIQAPANAGSLSPTGKLGIAAGSEVGFDIFSGLDGDAAVVNFGFAAIPTATANRFYEVDLLTGAVDYLGRFPTRVTDIAIDLDH